MRTLSDIVPLLKYVYAYIIYKIHYNQAVFLRREEVWLKKLPAKCVRPSLSGVGWVEVP